jgi:hypothetical protein
MDKEQESKSWRSYRDDVVASVLMGFGGGTANVALRAAKFYAENMLSSAPASKTREVALRMFYFSVSVAAIALDYITSQSAFQPIAQRKADLEDILRFGTDPSDTKRRLNLVLELVRSYLPNGAATASQLRARIDDASKAFPADIIAEVCALERAAHETKLPSLSELSNDASGPIRSD